MKTKKCNKCLKLQPISEFWRNKAKPDGYNYYCRTCGRTFDRKRYYKDIITLRKRKSQTARRMMEQYPEKWRARELLRYAVKVGRVKKEPCEVCGKTKVEAHHKNYNEPLKVNWVCIIHHREQYHRN